jgi:hypothetical protein
MLLLSVFLSFAAAFLWVIGWQISASLPPLDEGSGFLGFVAVLVAPPVCFFVFPAMFLVLRAVARSAGLVRPLARRCFMGLGGYGLLVAAFSVLNLYNQPSGFHTSIATPRPASDYLLQGGVFALTPLAAWLLYCILLDINDKKESGTS